MAIIVKCDPPELDARATFIAEEPLYARAEIEVGDDAFIWTSEKAGGQGLAHRATVTQCQTQSGRAQLRLACWDVALIHPVTIDDLAPLRDANDGSPLAGLSAKLYRHAHNKVAALDEAEAAFLAGRFAGE